jgi:hypothetical protein
VPIRRIREARWGVFRIHTGVLGWLLGKNRKGNRTEVALEPAFLRFGKIF